MLHIQKLTISNILGIDHFEMQPGKINAITGHNGAGKTSILEAIKAGLQSGHDATLLRRGAEQGEVVLVLDDDTAIRRRVSASKSDNQVKQDGKAISKPVDFLRRLADMTSVNPVDFLRATKKDRARVLLESMPIKVDEEKLAGLARTRVRTPDGTHALQVIEAYRKQVYDDRTGTNRAVKEKEGTINQLLDALPDAPGGVEGSEDEIRAQIQQAQDAMAAEVKRIDTKLDGLKAESANKVQALRDAANEDIEALQAQILARKQKLEDDIAAERAALADTSAKADRVRAKASATCAETVQPLTIALHSIVANRDAAAKRQATLETIEDMRKHLGELQADAERQTEAIEAIDAYKLDLLNSLPVPGLEVRDGDIYRDGVQFDRLNTAQQVSIAVEIAKLRTGDLGLICLDGMELLDAGSFEALKQAALESGLQLFVSRVTDDEMAVESE